jgi:hypothetical protein
MEKWISLTATNTAVPQKWKVLYAGANRCNDVIKTIALATDLSAEKALAIEAQARFLRAFYHFELKKVFNNIVYADETLTLDNTDNMVDAWPKIEADLQFAVANLPDFYGGAEPGRAMFGQLKLCSRRSICTRTQKNTLKHIPFYRYY